MATVVWDVDGTLIDSYAVMSGSLFRSLSRRGIRMTEEEILKEIKEYSVGSLLDRLHDSYGINREEINREYTELGNLRQEEIGLIDGAEEVLEELETLGIQNAVITHRGNNVFSIFDMLGIRRYFSMIITGDDGFTRKPDPESMEYLIKKLRLDRNKVWYIGDRRIDIDFSRNSGVHAVLLTENPDRFSDMDYSYFTVSSLYEVPKLLCDFGD